MTTDQRTITREQADAILAAAFPLDPGIARRIEEVEQQRIKLEPVKDDKYGVWS